MIPTQSAGGHPLPAIHHDDGRDVNGSRVLDVRPAQFESLLTIGEDLVLWWCFEDTTPGETRWLVGVCDSSANHLAVLANLAGGQEMLRGEVLAAAIVTAKAAFPNHVRIDR